MKRFWFSIILFALPLLNAVSAVYFQGPSKQSAFLNADVYVELDYGVLDKQTVSKSDSMRLTLQQKEISDAKDSEGRYAVWNLIPDYVYIPVSEDENLRVDIFLNDLSYLLTQDSVLGANGKYNVKYKVECSYRIINRQSREVLKDTTFVLKGVEESSALKLSESLSSASIISLTNAIHKVRQEVFSEYGFGVFEVDAKLKPTPCLLSAESIAGDVESSLNSKSTLVPDAETMNLLKSYCDILAYNLGSCNDDDLMSAYYNLALCSAWLQNEEAAHKAIEEYAGMCKTFADSASFYEISDFVETYPVSADRYKKMTDKLDGDIYGYANFYAYNDIISQVCDLPFLFQFLELKQYDDNLKTINGKIQSNCDCLPLQYTVSYSNGRPVKLEVWQDKVNKDGTKSKSKLNDMAIKYEKSGRFRNVTTVPSRIAKIFMPIPVNGRADSLSLVTSAKTQNVLGGFVKMKTETFEAVKLSLDPEGDVHIIGETLSSHPMSLYKALADSNNVEFPLAFSEFTTNFETWVEFAEDGFLQQLTWKGMALYEKNRGDFNYGYIRSDSIETRLLRVEENGEQYYEYIYSADVSNKWDKRMRWEDLNFFNSGSTLDFMGESKVTSGSGGKKVAVYESKFRWPVHIYNNEAGDWIKAEIGPYVFEREFVY